MTNRIFLALLAAVLPLALLAPSAEAKVVKPKVTISASDTIPELGSTIVFSGSVSGKSQNSKVVLQVKSGRTWGRVSEARVNSQRRYAFRLVVKRTEGDYRVMVMKKGKVPASASRPVYISATEPYVDEEDYLTEDEVNQIVLDEMNRHRATYGLEPLVPMAELAAVARNWSEHMILTNTFEHNPNFSQQYPLGWSTAGENILAGLDPKAAVDQWMTSPGHRANILGPFNRVGVGFVANSGRGADFGSYYTVNFAQYS